VTGKKAPDTDVGAFYRDRDPHCRSVVIFVVFLFRVLRRGLLWMILLRRRMRLRVLVLWRWT
jgi:hypothetical protein